MISDVLAQAVADIDQYLGDQRYQHMYIGQVREELLALRTLMDGARQHLDMLTPYHWIPTKGSPP